MEIKELIDLLPKDYEKECYEKKAIRRKRTIKNPLDLLVPCKVQNCIKIILICFWDMILFLKRSDQYTKEKI